MTTRSRRKEVRENGGPPSRVMATATYDTEELLYSEHSLRQVVSAWKAQMQV